jgi:hypothetical protein
MTIFKSFETLKNVRGLTDEQLMEVLANPCKESNSVSFEDDLTEILIAWLSAASGIQWRKAYQQSDRDELQYGTIFLLNSVPFGNAQHADFYDPLNPSKICTVISEPKTYKFQLDVYKDNGEVDSQQTPVVNNSPKASAYDVLNKLQTRVKHFIFHSALKEFCIYAGTGGFITDVVNMPEALRHSTNEARATAFLYVVCSPQSSISSGTIVGVETAFCFEVDPEE